MPTAPGYTWVRYSSRARPHDIVPYLFLDEQAPHVRKAAHKARISAMNDSNPRFADFQTHEQRMRELAVIADKARLVIWKIRNNRPMNQSDYDNILLAHQTLFNGFECMIPVALVDKVAKRLPREEVIN